MAKKKKKREDSEPLSDPPKTIVVSNPFPESHVLKGISQWLCCALGISSSNILDIYTHRHENMVFVTLDSSVDITKAIGSHSWDQFLVAWPARQQKSLIFQSRVAPETLNGWKSNVKDLVDYQTDVHRDFKRPYPTPEYAQIPPTSDAYRISYAIPMPIPVLLGPQPSPVVEPPAPPAPPAPPVPDEPPPPAAPVAEERPVVPQEKPQSHGDGLQLEQDSQITQESGSASLLHPTPRTPTLMETQVSNSPPMELQDHPSPRESPMLFFKRDPDEEESDALLHLQGPFELEPQDMTIEECTLPDMPMIEEGNPQEEEDSEEEVDQLREDSLFLRAEPDEERDNYFLLPNRHEQPEDDEEEEEEDQLRDDSVFPKADPYEQEISAMELLRRPQASTATDNRETPRPVRMDPQESIQDEELPLNPEELEAALLNYRNQHIPIIKPEPVDYNVPPSSANLTRPIKRELSDEKVPLGSSSSRMTSLGVKRIKREDAW